MILGIIFCAIIATLSAAPTTETFVTVADPGQPIQNDGRRVSTADTPKPELYSMKVYSTINTRYATTLVSSRVANPGNVSQEVFFSVVIPDSAFISEFVMELEGKCYTAYIKKKEDAKQIYNNAVASGIGAAHVEMSARHSNKFTVSVNVEARSKALFNLTYEELLTRRLGVYNLVVNLHPGQMVRDMSINVDIFEPQKISILRVPALRTGNEIDPDDTTVGNPYACQEYINPNHARVKFTPTLCEQKDIVKQLDDKTKTTNSSGINGQFVVQYDVERQPNAGEIVVYDGYFVHFFAPKGLEPLNKHVVFVLDVSGSMQGTKIAQLKEAMNVILDELRPGDYFNLVDFCTEAQVKSLENITVPTITTSAPLWFGTRMAPTPVTLVPPYPANKENIMKAKIVVKELQANGQTNIEQALKVALQLAALKPRPEDIATQKPGPLPEPIIMFLTDGDATVGETSNPKILKMVSDLNNHHAIFALAFGDDADRGFLQQLSIRNHGFMRQIYEANDAAVQLQQFYKQISSPLLRNVTFKYPDNQVEDLTNNDCHILFAGSEFVIAGKLVSSDLMLQPPIRIGHTSQGQPLDFITKVLTAPVDSKSKPSLQRLWAYIKIKQLLDKKDGFITAEDGVVLVQETTTLNPIVDQKNNSALEAEALKLALKYSFVTRLTSLVVVKPNSTADATVEALPVPVVLNQQSSALPLALGSKIPGTMAYFGASSSMVAMSTDYSMSYTDPNAASNRLDLVTDAAVAYSTSSTDLLKKYDLEKLTWLDIYDGYVKIDDVKLELYYGNNSQKSFGACPIRGMCMLVTKCPQKILLTKKSEYHKRSCPAEENGVSYFTMCCK